MAHGLSPEEIQFRAAVHYALGSEDGVFPPGHQWEGLTKQQSWDAVKAGFESGPAYLASLQPAVLVKELSFGAAEPAPAYTVEPVTDASHYEGVPDTGKLDSKKK